MARVVIESKDLPKGVNKQLVRDILKRHPGAQVDTTFIEGRTITPKDSEGRELPVVFLPPSITVDAPEAEVDAVALLGFIKSKSYEKTDEQIGREKKAEELFDLLMLSPRFAALFLR
jgi:hypothetical protein